MAFVAQSVGAIIGVIFISFILGIIARSIFKLSIGWATAVGILLYLIYRYTLQIAVGSFIEYEPLIYSIIAAPLLHLLMKWYKKRKKEENLDD